MFVTQPTLTARLHALERELGEPLFARTRRGMRLTDAGRAFLPYAERAMRAVRDGRQALADARSASAGRLVLGAAPAVSTYVLPALLQRFAAAYPRIEVAVRTGHSEDVLQMLLREEVQLAMVRTMRHPDIESIPLYEEALVLVVAPGHPFAKRSNVGIADVASERLTPRHCAASAHRRRWRAGRQNPDAGVGYGRAGDVAKDRRHSPPRPGAAIRHGRCLRQSPARVRSRRSCAHPLAR